MNEEPETNYTSPAPLSTAKKGNKTAKVLGVVLLVLILLAATAAGVYAWKQNEITIQKNDFESKLAEAKATQKGDQGTSAGNGRPTHEQAPAKTVTETTCNADELTLSLADGDGGGAGTTNQMIVLANSGDRTCTLGGFPGVSLVNDNGNQVGSPAERATNYVEKTLTLKPKDQAKATLSYQDQGNFDPGVCKMNATKLRVYPPNDTGYLSIASTKVTAWCPGFEISPVQ